MMRHDALVFGDRGRCPDCGKLCWGSRADAKRFAKRMHPGDHLRAYRCGDYWHLGHLASHSDESGDA